jgi:Fe2+ or Zn2+ uptake regulation protein
MTRPSMVDLRILAEHSVYFLRDKNLKMHLWIHDQGKIEEIPCSKLVKEAAETRKFHVNKLYETLLERHGYNK